MAESHLKIAMKRIRKEKLAVAGFFVICLFALVALLDTVPVPYRDAGGMHYFNRTVLDALSKSLWSVPIRHPSPGRPCSTARSSRLKSRHLLGTNILGEDVLYDALKGVRTAFIIGIVPLDHSGLSLQWSSAFSPAITEAGSMI